MVKKENKLPEFWHAYEGSFAKGLPKAISETNFVVLDTETTGFSFKKDRILSIGALRIQNGRIEAKEAFEVFLQQDTFDKGTVPIHGILKTEKINLVTEIEGLKMLLNLLNNAVLIAHHVRFDVGMINQALERNGLPKLLNEDLDTALLYNRTLPKSERKIEGNYSLDELSEQFKISKSDRHTALGDAYITAIAFLHILEKLKPASLQQLLKKDRFWEFWKF